MPDLYESYARLLLPRLQVLHMNDRPTSRVSHYVTLDVKIRRMPVAEPSTRHLTDSSLSAYTSFLFIASIGIRILNVHLLQELIYHFCECHILYSSLIRMWRLLHQQ